jgi:formate-dependent phosphoribosylglycinamide formyltransferase (GAR transformylase)
VRRWLTHYEQVPSVVDEGRLIETVRWVQGRLWVDRLEATIEAHVMAAARAREACGIPGTSVHTTYLCRDKPAMKEALRAADVPCARSAAPRSGDDVRRFAADVGFPLILKPAAGAGAAGAERVDGIDELDGAIARSGVDRGAEVAVEEFVEGHEGFYDTITIGGTVAVEFVTHYYPNVLEAMRTRWISPYYVTTNRIDAPAYEELRRLGQRVITALGIETSATHMEWFAGSKGLYFSEIGARPPGVRVWDLYSAANDFDIYREWANAIVHGHVAATPSRRFAAGLIALRPDRDGTISGYSGIDEIQARYGEWVLDAHLPPPGTPTQGVEAGYMANAWVRMRHPDYDVLRDMFDDVGRTVQVHAV